MANLNLKPYLKHLLILTGVIMLASGLAHAQYTTVSGKITDAETLKPLANAEVFIANTTIRAKTDVNGNYTITQLPTGTYELLAWCSGYVTKSQQLVATALNKTLNIALNIRVIELAEVTISESGDRKLNLARFRREFLGVSGKELCTILNEDVLNLKYNSKTDVLTATADDFLEIRNPILGYKLRFLIKEFSVDYKASVYHYGGSVIFEDLDGTEKEKRAWLKSRSNTYDGSFRHFVASLAANQAKKNGYIIKRLTRVPNPERPPDSIIRYKMENQFRYALNNSKAVRDSAAKWSKLNQLPRIIETLGTEEIAYTTILKPGKLAQTYDLAFRGYLYVIYKDKYVVTRSDLLRSLTGGGLARFKEAKDYQIAAFSMKTPGQPITFSNKGIQLSDGKFFYEGTWGDSRVADILPFDYVPQ